MAATLRIGADHALRVVAARFRVEVDAVDDVAEIARQGHAALRLGGRAARLGELARPCGRPSPPGACWRKSGLPPSAAAHGRCRGCCSRGIRQSFPRNRRPAAGSPCPAATSASCAFRSRASPAKTSGGKLASTASVRASSAASSYSGKCFASHFFQPSGVQVCATLRFQSLTGRRACKRCPPPLQRLHLVSNRAYFAPFSGRTSMRNALPGCRYLAARARISSGVDLV